MSAEVVAPAYAQMGRTCCQHLPDPLWLQAVDLGSSWTSPDVNCPAASCYGDLTALNGGSDVFVMGRTFTFLPSSPVMWSCAFFPGSLCAKLTNLILRCTDNPNFPYTRRYSLTTWSDFDPNDQIVYAPDPTSTDVPFLLIFPSVQAGGPGSGHACTWGVRITDTHP